MADNEVTEKRSEKARRLGPPTYDKLKKKQPRTRRLSITLNDEVAAEYYEVKNEVNRLRIRQEEVSEELTERLSELEEQVEESTVELVFHAIGRKKFEQLLSDHPAEEEHVEEARRLGLIEAEDKLDYNPHTFPSHLVALSLAEPKLTPDQVDELFDEWNGAEVTSVFMAAMEVNTQRRVVELGNS